MFTIDSRSSVPIFEQILQEIGKYIALNILKPDDQLPTVRTLARDLGINPNTVAKAYQEAERAGLVYPVSGIGMFVSKESQGINTLKENAYNTLYEIYNKLLELGETNDTIIERIRGYIL